MTTVTVQRPKRALFCSLSPIVAFIVPNSDRYTSVYRKIDASKAYNILNGWDVDMVFDLEVEVVDIKEVIVSVTR